MSPLKFDNLKIVKLKFLLSLESYFVIYNSGECIFYILNKMNEEKQG